MDFQNSSEEEKKRNLGLCMSAGIETPNDEDPTRFQRRHFPNKMTSDIFFCDSPLENVSRKSGDDIYTSAGVDTRYNDQKQSEKRHFHLSSEDGTMTRDYPDQDGEEIDSCETAEPRKSVGRDDYLSEEMDKHNADPKQSEKRHFYLSTVDGTMTSDFANQNEEGEHVDSSETTESRENADRDESRENADRDESRENADRDDYLSEEIDKRNADQEQDNKMTGDFENQGEKDEDESSNTEESRETEDDDDSDQKKTQRRHFHDKMSSNIFFSGLPIENISIKDPADPSDFRKRKG